MPLSATSPERALRHALLVAAAACGSPTPSEPPPPPALVGSAACAGCHAEAAEAWRGSHHATAERDAAQLPPGSPTLAPLDRATPAPITRVIGVEPLWQPLITADGRTQVSSTAWDVAAGAWFEVFADARSPGDWGHWTGRGMTWDRQCAHCHATGVRVSWTAATDRYTTTVAEHGVGCESCHGPGSAHAADPRTPTPGPTSRDAVAETCEACHVRAATLPPGPTAGRALLDVAVPALPGPEAVFQPDGQVEDEDFEAVAFRLSRMHAGGVRCQDCHAPHSAGLKQPAPALCVGCHGPQAEDHAHHAPDQASCVDCHMPVTTYMQRDPRHDHRFLQPDVALAAELGIGTACARCHDDLPKVAAASAGWWTFPEPDRQTTRAIAAAEAGAPDAPQRLALALREETRAMWRAVLIAAGAPDPGASASPEPWIRLAAASAPGARPEGLLADPVAAVRHAAARALEPIRGPDDPAMRFHRDLLEQMGDLPPYAAELATWWGSHGAADRAVPLLERAARLDPANPEHLRNLAVVRSANGDPAGAYALLQRAAALAPADADLAYLLGLAAHGAGRPNAAADAFARARKLDPRHPRAAYNLGLLLAERRDPAALTTLREAADLAPADPDPWWAIATVLAQRGDRDGARAAAERTLRLDPNHAEARQMIGR